MFQRRKDGGFTLIELMIVIAVIGILAIVLVPRLAGIKDGAKEVGVTTNVKSVQAYVTANISKWAKNDDDEASIATDLYVNFKKSDNTLVNPITNSDNITSSVGGKQSYDSTAKDIPTADNTDDVSLQIVGETTNLSNPKGAVRVYIGDLHSDGIKVTGYNAEGNEVDSITIKY